MGSGRSDGGIGDGSEQVFPALEHHIGCDGAQMLEEAVSGTTRGHGLAPSQHREHCDGMECEGQQVERKRRERPTLPVGSGL